MKLETAYKITLQLYNHLLPHCETIHIAGSVSREVPDVNDIELVCRPKGEPVTDLFGNIIGFKRCSSFIHACKQIGNLLSGKPDTGRHIKYDVNNANIRLDLFIPQAHDYYRILAIRIGSQSFSERIAIKWTQMGWCGTSDGLRKQQDCEVKTSGDKKVWVCKSKNPTLPPVWKTEADFFTWLGLPYFHPKKRF